MKHLLLLASLLSLSSIATAAENPWMGTWILREAEPGGELTLKIEEMSGGWKLTYKVIGPGAPGASYTTVETTLDGKDVPVMIDGNTSGQTMGITKVDEQHTVNVIKYEGKEIGTSKTDTDPVQAPAIQSTPHPDCRAWSHRADRS